MFGLDDYTQQLIESHNRRHSTPLEHSLKGTQSIFKIHLEVGIVGFDSIAVFARSFGMTVSYQIILQPMAKPQCSVGKHFSASFQI